METTKCTWEHENCFALLNGECRILTDTDFPGREDCPFYKDKEEAERQQDELSLFA